MRLYRRKNTWYVEYEDASGKRLRISTGTPAIESEAEARRAASARISRIISGGESGPAAVNRAHNLAEALERTYLTRWKNSRNDIQLKYVVRMLERSIGFWLLKDIDYRQLKTYRDGLLAAGTAPGTINRRMSLLKVAIKEAVREGDLAHMPEFPPTLAENNISERYLTTDEEVTVMTWLKATAAAEAIAPDTKPQWEYILALVEFLIDTGCRLGEALNAKPGDVLPHGLHLRWGDTKSTKARVVPLIPRRQSRARNTPGEPVPRQGER